MRNIAITGKMAAGKSTISNQLVDYHGFKRASFAARLKEVAAAVYAPAGEQVQKDGSYDVTRPDGIVESLSGRQVLQELGQVVKSMDRDMWVRWLDKDLRTQAGPFVLDDMRFDFEAEFLRAPGWLIVRIETRLSTRLERYERLYGRKPTAAELYHESEVGVDDIDVDLIVPGDLPAHAVGAELARLASIPADKLYDEWGHVASEFCICRPKVTESA